MKTVLKLRKKLGTNSYQTKLKKHYRSFGAEILYRREYVRVLVVVFLRKEKQETIAIDEFSWTELDDHFAGASWNPFVGCYQQI